MDVFKAQLELITVQDNFVATIKLLSVINNL